VSSRWSFGTETLLQRVEAADCLIKLVHGVRYKLLKLPDLILQCLRRHSHVSRIRRHGAIASRKTPSRAAGFR
jgi:hypothetical protein